MCCSPWVRASELLSLIVVLSSTTMLVRVLSYLLLLIACGSSLRVGRPAHATSSRAAAVTMGGPWEKANVPRGRVVMNPFENLKQMQDQRVAGLSHSARPCGPLAHRDA